MTSVKSTNQQKYETKNPIRRLCVQNFQRTLLKAVRQLAPETLLDAGCGEGFNLSMINGHHSAKLYGIDLSSQAVSLAKKRIPDAEVQTGSVYSIPYADNSFDTVLCTEVLEHLDNPEHAISELLRVSNRYVVATVPHEPFFQIGNFLSLKYMKRFGNHPEHINRWTRHAFVALLASKMSVLEVYSPFPWTLVIGMLR
ncbi:methylase involved in ubiquinone/menaquinone biosynthesis [Opitutaceae bacterium TAV1]|nr:methylase involved in ubiquinone/menaquinone biosynthesis [Opitutaceae bacterium TAV1]